MMHKQLQYRTLKITYKNTAYRGDWPQKVLIFELQFWAWNCSFQAELRCIYCSFAIPIAVTAIKIAEPQLKLRRLQLIAVRGGRIAVQNRGKLQFICGGRNSIAVDCNSIAVRCN